MSAHHPISSYDTARARMTVDELRASGLYYAIVPARSRDEYAAGYDGNAFATEVEAFGEGAIEDWRVIERAYSVEVAS